MEEVTTRFLEVYQYLLRENYVKNAVDFARNIGISASMMTEILKHRTNVGIKGVQNTVLSYSIDANWLLTGSGCMLKTEPSLVLQAIELSTSTISDETIDHQLVPLYDIATVVNLQSLFIDAKKHIIDTIKIPNLSRCDGGICIAGDSMYPLLQTGDIVLFKQVVNRDFVQFGEMYLVSYNVDGDDHLVVKYLHKAEKEGWIRLTSYNQYYTPLDIPDSSIGALALVKASVRFNRM